MTRRIKPWLLFVLIPLLLAGVAGVGYLGFRSGANPAAAQVQPPPTVTVATCDVEKTVTAPGSLVDTRRAELEMPANGKLAGVDVLPGQAVQAGQVLARLEGRSARQQAVDQARLAVLQAQQALDQLPVAAQKEAAQLQLDLLKAQEELERVERWRTYLGYPEEIQDSVINKARRAYQLAQAQYEHAAKVASEVKQLPPGHPKQSKAQQALSTATLQRDRTKAELDRLLADADQDALTKADADVALAQANVAEMTRRLQALATGPAELDRAESQAKLAQAQSALQTAEEALAALEVKAPFASVVLEVKANPGESLAEGSPLLTLSDPQALEVAALVIEEDLPLVQVGQAVRLYFDAAPEADVTGQVARIVPQRVEGDRPLYRVYLALDQVPAGLVEGMSADAVILLERAAGVLCLPRALVRAGTGQTATVQVWTGGRVEARTVQVGLRGDTDVAILSGLQAGEAVVAK